MAAGLALKNSFTSRDYARLKEVQTRWLQQIDNNVKANVKALALKAIASSDRQSGTQAAQFLTSLAAIELPRNLWPELMPTLVQSVGEGSDAQKQASLSTIGFICENDDADLRTSLSQYSNSILTAVVQGARKEEQNDETRSKAITALGDSLEFVRNNFENEGERNYIMQVVCEATQASDPRVMQGAYGCLNRIMALYYDKMYFYMEKALFGLTIQGMKNDEEDVAKLAVEFWCTVCEEEISIEDDNTSALSEGTEQRPFFNFAKIATQEVVPVLLDLLTKQDEDAADDEYNTARAAYQCLQLWAQAVGNIVCQPILGFIEANIRSEDWHLRDAAVSALGAIMEGPDEKMLDNIVKQGLPILIGMMSDSNLHVKDSVAFTLGRISDCVPDSIDASAHLPALVQSLFNGLESNPKMAASCCWALMNLARCFSLETAPDENPMTAHFDPSMQALMNATESNAADNTVRTAAYEVMNSFIENAGRKSFGTIGQLTGAVISRLESTIPLRSQIVSVEDRLTLDEMQTSLCTVVMSIVQRLDTEIKPQADKIMELILQLLGSLNNTSSVADSAFAVVGAMATATEGDFIKYMQAFSPILLSALNNHNEPSLCAMSVGLVSDITRALGAQVQPYCDELMNSLLENLRSTALANAFKPAILQCFGDIAQAIGGAFVSYLPIVAQVLDQATSINIDTSSYELIDYLVSLREGITDAWAGIILALKDNGLQEQLKPYVEQIFRLLNMIWQDPNRTEGVLRSAMGVLGDLSEAFPGGEISGLYKQEWVMAMVKDTKSNRDHEERTINTARWAREQVKRQTSMSLM